MRLTQTTVFLLKVRLILVTRFISFQVFCTFLSTAYQRMSDTGRVSPHLRAAVSIDLSFSIHKSHFFATILVSFLSGFIIFRITSVTEWAVWGLYLQFYSIRILFRKKSSHDIITMHFGFNEFRKNSLFFFCLLAATFFPDAPVSSDSYPDLIHFPFIQRVEQSDSCGKQFVSFFL